MCSDGGQTRRYDVASRRPKAIYGIRVCLFLAVNGLSLWAQPAEGNETEVARAIEHFRLAVELFHEGRLPEALAQFQAAYDTKPNWKVLYNIGQIQGRLGEYTDAVKTYERYLKDGGGAVPASRREIVREQLQRLRRRIGYVSIWTAPSGARVFIGKRSVGRSPVGPVALPIGRHQVEVRDAQFESRSAVIEIASSRRTGVNLLLKRQTEEPSSHPELSMKSPPRPELGGKLSPVQVTLGVVSAAAIVATATTFALAYDAQEDVADAFREVPTPIGTVREARSRLDTFSTGADAAGVAAVTLSAAFIASLVFGW